MRLVQEVEFVFPSFTLALLPVPETIVDESVPPEKSVSVVCVAEAAVAVKLTLAPAVMFASLAEYLAQLDWLVGWTAVSADSVVQLF